MITVDVGGCDFFFLAVRTAVLLQRERRRDVHVLLLPLGSPLWRVISAAGRAGKNGRQGIGVVSEGTPAATRAGLYEQVRRGDAAVVRNAEGHIRIEKFDLSAFGQAIALGRAMSSLPGVMLKAFGKYGFDPLGFLEGRYRGVRIGDIAASWLFRRSFGRGELSSHPFLWYAFVEAAYMVNAAAEASEKHKDAPVFSMPSEPTYLPAAAHRYLTSRGAATLDAWQPSVGLDVSYSSDGDCTRFAPPEAPRPVAPDEVIAEYFERRLSSMMQVLYEAHGENDNEASCLRDREGYPVPVPDGGPCVGVFLHSFGDAQYYFGLDGFKSLGDWTLQTLEACLANTGISHVFIKPHPSESYAGMDTDALMLEEIRSRYGESPRVTILHRQASLVRLCEAPRFIGITHHGSVAEEVVHLNRPVIASVYGPWGDEYEFVRRWSSPSEYRRMLSAISAESWSPPTARERDELARYVTDHRLSEISGEHRYPRLVWANVLARAEGRPPVEWSPENYKRHEGVLHGLSADHPHFHALIDEFRRLPVRLRLEGAKDEVRSTVVRNEGEGWVTSERR